MRDFLKSSVIRADMEDIYSRDIPIRQLYHKTVMVTGASGMLASYLIWYLIWLNETHDADISILVMGRKRERLEERFGIYAGKSYLRFIIADVCDFTAPDISMDYIVHAASLASPQYYLTVPVEVASANAIGTYRLLRLAAARGVKGFLYFSSGDVYGAMPDGTGIFGEDQMGVMDPLDIHSCYGESKRMGETWCACFAREYGIRACAARIGHTYSPTMDIDRDPRVFASFMRCAVRREDIVMLSDGTAKRPFCYVADAVAAFILLLLQGKGGEAYNVVNTEMFVSIAELAETIASLEPEAGLRVIRKNRLSDDGYLENTLNHANCLGNERLKALGWRPEYDIKQGFTRVLRFIREE